MLKNPSQVAKSTQHYFLAFLLLCSSPLPTCCAHMNPFQDDLPEATASIPETRSNYTAPAAKIPKLLHLGLLHDHPCVAVEWTQLWTHVLICTWHDLFDMRKFISTDLVVLKKAWFFWIDDLGCWFFDGRFWRQSVYSIYSFVVLSKTKVDHVATHRGPIGFPYLEPPNPGPVLWKGGNGVFPTWDLTCGAGGGRKLGELSRYIKWGWSHLCKLMGIYRAYGSHCTSFYWNNKGFSFFMSDAQKKLPNL